MRTAHVLMIGAILCAMGITGCRAEIANAEQAAVSVKVKTIEMNRASGGARYSANIIPRSQVEMAFKVGGYVEWILQARGADGRMRNLQAGDIVTKGTALARVRQSDYAVKVSQAESQVSEAKSSLESSQAQLADARSAVESSKAQLAEAEAAFERARLEFDRAKTLFSSNSLTKTDYDAARTQFEVGDAKRAAARAQVAMLEARVGSAAAQIEALRARIKGAQAAVAEAVIPLQDTSLRAPMNAVVLQRTVEIGALVAPGQSAFTLADLSSVKAIFGAPDLMVNKLKLGGDLTVTTEALPGARFHGQITRIAPAADAKSRVFEVEVAIPNPDRALKSGLIASLELADDDPSRQVVVTPLASIVRFSASPGSDPAPDQYAVFVVEDQRGAQVARLRQVKLGEALGNTIAVLDGVNVGERVITMGATLVKDGQPVQVIP